EFMELAKHAGDGLLHLSIRYLLAAVIFGAYETDGHFPQGMTALHLLLEGLTGTLAEQTQLEFAHGPLQSQNQTVVNLLGIVHTMMVDEAGVGNGAKIEEMMPVAFVPRQRGCFEPQPGARLAATNRGQQLSEAGPID